MFVVDFLLTVFLFLMVGFFGWLFFSTIRKINFNFGLTMCSLYQNRSVNFK